MEEGVKKKKKNKEQSGLLSEELRNEGATKIAPYL